MNILKFIFRFFIHLSILLLVSLPLQLMGALILLIACPAVQNNPLPRALRWFDNADQYINRDASTYLAVRASGWWNNYCWLAWRNPCNYFGYVVLGFKVNNLVPKSYAQIFFNESIPTPSMEVGDTTYSGLEHSECTNNGSTYYEYYYVYHYEYLSSLLNTPLCLRVRIGYKLGDTSQLQIGQYVEQVFVISPFHSFTGVN